MTRRKVITWTVCVIVAIALTAWIHSRWDAWFHNPEEAPYVAPAEPSRLLLTFGDEGEMSRYVSWMCGDAVADDAELLLALADDTTHIAARGEVFVSRAGQAAYYRAHVAHLLPDTTYRYAVVTAGHQSPWHQFRTSDPGRRSFSFLFMGDVQDTLGGIGGTLLRQAIGRHPQVEFVAFGGDLVERPTDAYWAETFRTLDSVATAMPVLNITGNHDYLKYLIRKCEHRFALVFPYFLKGQAERDDSNHLFHLDYHGTHFYLLDSDRGAGFQYAQRRWLQRELEASSGSAHRIVMLHHPLYSVKRPNNNMVARWMFNDVVLTSDVELVLQGHEHTYTHCTPSEEPLTTADCTELPLYTVSHCSPKNYNPHPSGRFSPVLNDSRYYQIIDVAPEAITMRGFDAITGAQIDSVRIAPQPLPTSPGGGGDKKLVSVAQGNNC